MTNQYANEKLYMAIISMIPDEGLKEKLIEINANHICHITPDNDLPPELHGLYKEIQSNMDALDDEETIEQTRDKILTLFGELHSFDGY
ncbi:hypothetical protein ACK1CN_00060 [Vibrio coralliilyticus]|uniref:hypothetical protein n=1 Tax=Vibrio coralliilyticus TaxID=190893 RepID=UPI0039174C05